MRTIYFRHYGPDSGTFNFCNRKLCLGDYIECELVKIVGAVGWGKDQFGDELR